jgi:hypothetical protein
MLSRFTYLVEKLPKAALVHLAAEVYRYPDLRQ